MPSAPPIPPPYDEPPPADLIPADDPFIQAQVARVLTPLDGRVSAEVLESMRAHLILALTTDPRGIRLVERARRTPRVERSGTRETPGATSAGKKERAG
jgi:hypothetical protein